MTDKELLELAAKAAGVKGDYLGGDIVHHDKPNLSVVFWNPLKHDGDALRLAVKLRLDICTDDNDTEDGENPISHVNIWRFSGGVGCSELLGDDPYAATRRAIVRAAAEIGKAMP